jgi:invasion protein IalB
VKINRIHFAAAAAGSALALAVGLGHGAVSVAQPNNGGGWDKDGFLYCLQMQPPDTNPHDWAVACCIQNGGHPTDDGTCHPPDGNTPRPRLAQILAPATITPKLSTKVSP